MDNCCHCLYMGFDICANDLVCHITGSLIPDDFKCNCEKWRDKYESTRCDNWREYNLNPKRHDRNKQLDKFGKYMRNKHRVWLWTSEAEPHDIMGGHIGW